MPVGDCMQTNDRPLTDLMKAIAEGKAQLPDFQRGWVWDDNRIKALILSVIHNYPVGAAMFLSYGNESIHFKHKPIEGSPNQNKDVAPDELILDGQQRLTSLYNALYSKNAVHTKTDKGKLINRFYYLSIDKALDLSADDEEIVISVPESRQITSALSVQTIPSLKIARSTARPSTGAMSPQSLRIPRLTARAEITQSGRTVHLP